MIKIRCKISAQISIIITLSVSTDITSQRNVSKEKTVATRCRRDEKKHRVTYHNNIKIRYNATNKLIESFVILLYGVLSLRFSLTAHHFTLCPTLPCAVINQIPLDWFPFPFASYPGFMNKYECFWSSASLLKAAI